MQYYTKDILFIFVMGFPLAFVINGGVICWIMICGYWWLTECAKWKSIEEETKRLREQKKYGEFVDGKWKPY